MWRADILRVGSEPVVLWDRDEESDLHKFTVMMNNWTFGVPGHGIFIVELVTGTPVHGPDGEPLVPSDEPVDIEHGFITIFGYSVEDLRRIAIQHHAPAATPAMDPTERPAPEPAAEEPHSQPESAWWRRVGPWRRRR